jgi:hypothetical protein
MFLICSWCRAVRSPVAVHATARDGDQLMSDKVPIIVVLGIDVEGKPHASRFDERDMPLVERAAEMMGFRVIRVAPDNEKLHPLAAALPAGKIFATGRAFVPFVGRAAFDKLGALIEGGLTVAPRAPSEAPPADPVADRDRAEAISAADVLWAKIEVGTTVLAAADPEEWGPSWWEAVVVEVDHRELTLRWVDEPEAEPFYVARRDVALRHPGAD